MKEWTSRKIAALLRRLNSQYGEERYMHRNNRVYEHDVKNDVYIFLCNDEDLNILIKER